MKKLIVNADDFGLTEGINLGIIECFTKGIVTSATLMVNMPGYEHAVNLAKKNQGLGVGIHLNLLKGKPVQLSYLVPTLVNRSGSFLTMPKFLSRLLCGRIYLAEVEVELRAQIEKMIDSGLRISHIDSHRHIHIFPPIMKCVLKLCKEYNISKMRFPLSNSFRSRSTMFYSFSSHPGVEMKEIIVNCLSKVSKTSIQRNGIICPDFYFDFIHVEKENLLRFEHFCKAMQEGAAEMVCHPGYMTEKIDGVEGIGSDREKQLEILTDCRVIEMLRKYQIYLTNYDSFDQVLSRRP